MAEKPKTDRVRDIIETDVGDSTIKSCISAANHIVENKLGDSDLSSSLLTEIQKWLAAHFIAAPDPRPESESLADSKHSYQGEYGLGLDGTDYGQRAQALDTTGTLAKMKKKSTSWEVSNG